MAPVLIKEITRRVNLTGIWQALYTAGVFIPKPISTCRYFHRSLNPKKLIDVGFSSLSRNMTMSRTIKLYKLPDAPKLTGLRRMDPKRDLKQMFTLMTAHMEKFDLVPMFDQEELAHWVSPRPDVVDCWVVEVTLSAFQDKLKLDLVPFISEIEPRQQEERNCCLFKLLHSPLDGDESPNPQGGEGCLLFLQCHLG